MLDANRYHISPPGAQGAAETDETSGAERFAYALGIVRRRIFVVLLLATVGACPGAVVFLKAVPTYTATATLLVDTRKSEIVQQPALTSPMPIEARGAMESQVELLRSDEVALAVIKKLGLWQDPRFVGVDKGGIVKGGDNGGIVRTLYHRFFSSFSAEQSELTDDERMQLALGVFARNLTVNRVDITYAIEIAFASRYADLAAQVANGVADAYIDLQRRSEYNAARQGSDWLETRVPELRAKSEVAQRAVVEYKNEHNIVETGGGESIDEQRVADLSAKLNAARDETLKAKARSEQLSAMGSADTAEAVANASIGNDATNDAFGKLRSAYFEVTSKEAELSAKYGPNNTAIISLRNQKTQLRSEILDEIQRLKQSSSIDYEAAQLRETAHKEEFDAAVSRSRAAGQAQVKLRELEASARAYQDLYNTFLNRYNASLQQAMSPVPAAIIITRATPLDAAGYKNGSKKTLLGAALYPIAGLGLGLGVALLLELLAGRAFRTSKSVQSRLHVACIGVLPRGEHAKRPRPSKQSGGAPAQSIVRGDRGISWSVIDYPLSRFAEGVRSIKLAIDMDTRTKSRKVIGFTSAIPNEVKSTVALALGQLLARNGAAVVVLDCDFRNPSLTRSLAPNATKGIIDLVTGETQLEDVVWKDRSTQMAFLPTIPRPGPRDPPTNLASDEKKRVYDELQKRYEYVVVDLSPLTPVIDVCATTELIGSYVLVIEWGRTTIDVVEHALRATPGVAESLIGAVLNKADMKELAKYDPYLSGHYFGKSYLRN